ncbi:MAG: macrolide ABC transporter ATP-binding protein [Acidimicrobiia bacterium]
MLTFVPALEAKGVRKVYRGLAEDVEALKGIDLLVEPGEFVAVMGPSGSGKTTLLNCLSGLDTIDEGQVRVEGVDIHALSDKALSKFRAMKIGFVFQSFNLIPEFSAVENVELPLLLAGKSPAEARKSAVAILEKLGMSKRLGHRPSELSGGEQQRVAIARALVSSPAIVWADEPTGNLDSENSKAVLRLLRHANSEGHTVVMVTHDREVASVAKRLVQMRDGRILSDEPITH